MRHGLKPLPEHLVVYTERTEDLALSGRLRAIADRDQGDLWEPLTVREIAETCEEAGAVRSAEFWRGYMTEAECADPAPYPVRTCPICGARVVPAALGALRLICPVCDPFTVREPTAETAEASEA